MYDLSPLMACLSLMIGIGMVAVSVARLRRTPEKRDVKSDFEDRACRFH